MVREDDINLNHALEGLQVLTAFTLLPPREYKANSDIYTATLVKDSLMDLKTPSFIPLL